MGPVTTQFARIDPGPSQAFGVVGASVTAVGAVLAVLAFTVVNWYKGATSSSLAHFSDVHDVLNATPGAAAGPAKAYFSWLAWVLLVAAVIAALVAVVPTIGSAFRFIAPVVAAGGVVATFLAVRLFTNGTGLDGAAGSYLDYLKAARLGFYLAVAGFVLVGLGALIGPRRQAR